MFATFRISSKIDSQRFFSSVRRFAGGVLAFALVMGGAVSARAQGPEIQITGFPFNGAGDLGTFPMGATTAGSLTFHSLKAFTITSWSFENGVNGSNEIAVSTITGGSGSTGLTFAGQQGTLNFAITPRWAGIRHSVLRINTDAGAQYFGVEFTVTGIQMGFTPAVTSTVAQSTVANTHRSGLLAIDAQGDLFYSDARYTVTKWDAATQTASVYAGSGGFGNGGDGGPATSASLEDIDALSVSPNGDLYILTETTQANVRRVSAQDGTISTDTQISATTPLDPIGPMVAVATGGIYYATQQGNVFYSRGGVVTQVAGRLSAAPQCIDHGGASSMTYSETQGTLYLGIQSQVYSLTPASTVDTQGTMCGPMTLVAGTTTPGYVLDPASDPTQQQFSRIITGVAQRNGQLYIADWANFVIRAVQPHNSQLFAGTGVSGYSGDGGEAPLAALGAMGQLVVDEAGDVYAVDTDHALIRKFSMGTGHLFFADTDVNFTSADSPQSPRFWNLGYSITNAPTDSVHFQPPFNMQVQPQPGGVTDSTEFPTQTGSTDECQGHSVSFGTYCDGRPVLFEPTVAGLRTATYTEPIDPNFPYPAQTFALQGNATTSSAQNLTISPAEFNFGLMSIVPGDPSATSAPTVFTVANPWPFAVKIASVTIPTGPFTISANTCGATLTAFASCMVTVTANMAGRAVGAYTGLLTIVSNAQQSPATATLDAFGVSSFQGGAFFTITPASHDFGTTNASGAFGAFQITVTNTGTATGILGPVTFPAPFNGWGLAGDSCSGRSLLAGDSCSFFVTPLIPNMYPFGLQSKTFSLSVSGGVPSTLSTTLSVTVVEPPLNPTLTISANSLNFSNVPVNTTAQQTLTINNTSLAAQAFPGTATLIGDPAYTLTGNTCTTAIAHPGSCQLQVTFSPTSVGSYAGQAAIAFTGPTPANAPAPAAAVPSSFTVPITGTAVNGGGGATITATQNTVDFGSVEVGSASAGIGVNLQNSSTTDAIHIYGVTLSDTTNFTVTNFNCQFMAPGGACTLQFAFNPTVPGPLSADVSITSDGTPSPLVIHLTGTGTTTAPTLSITSSLEFGSVSINAASAGQLVTVTNSGSSDVTLGVPTFSDMMDFAISNNLCGTTLAANSTCTFQVSFTPTTSGDISGSVTLSTNGAPATLSTSLHGVGVANGPITLTTTQNPVDFGTVQVGVTTGQVGVNLTNIGTDPIHVYSVTLSDMTNFTVTNANCQFMAPGGACTLFFAFHPTVPGPLNATVQVVTDGNPNPLVIGLTGVGASNTGMLTISPPSVDFGTVQVGQTTSTQPVTVTNLEEIRNVANMRGL